MLVPRVAGKIWAFYHLSRFGRCWRIDLSFAVGEDHAHKAQEEEEVRVEIESKFAGEHLGSEKSQSTCAVLPMKEDQVPQMSLHGHYCQVFYRWRPLASVCMIE